MSIQEDHEPSIATQIWEEGKTIAAAVEELEPILRSEHIDDDDRIVLQNCINELTGLAQSLADQSACEAAGGQEADVPNVYDWNR